MTRRRSILHDSTGNLLAAKKTANAILEVATLRPQNALQVRRD
jgi:hypothetical protein